MSGVLAFIEQLAREDDIATAKEHLRIIENVVLRTRMTLGDRQRAILDADPAEQARRAAVLAGFEAEQAAADAAHAAREAVRDARPVIGTLTLTTIRPKYLQGKTLEIVGQTPTKWECNAPDDPSYRHWAGKKGIRVPKKACTGVIIHGQPRADAA